VCHFFAEPGEKMTHEALNSIGKRKSYFVFSLAERENENR